MRRQVTVTLTRLRRVRGRQKKRTKKVVVESLTLGRFLRFLHVCARRASHTILNKNTQDWIRALSAKDFCDLADLVCPHEPPRWYKGWASVRNTWELIDGMLDTNEVGRLMQAVNLDPDSQRSGTMDGDVTAIAKQFGLAPRDVMAWYADEFLDTVKGLNDLATERDDTKTKPDPLGAFAAMPGVGTVN